VRRAAGDAAELSREEDSHPRARPRSMKLHQILIVALALLTLALGGWAVQGMRRLATV